MKRRGGALAKRINEMYAPLFIALVLRNVIILTHNVNIYTASIFFYK